MVADLVCLGGYIYVGLGTAGVQALAEAPQVGLVAEAGLDRAEVLHPIAMIGPPRADRRLSRGGDGGEPDRAHAEGAQVVEVVGDAAQVTPMPGLGVSGVCASVIPVITIGETVDQHEVDEVIPLGGARAGLGVWEGAALGTGAEQEGEPDEAPHGSEPG